MLFACLILNLVWLGLADVPVAEPASEEVTPDTKTHFRPSGFAGNLPSYDLEKVFQENKSMADAGKPCSYSSFLVKEFSEHYYPSVEFRWQGRGFHHVGRRKKDEHTRQEVFLSWQSFDDSLSWGFFHAELDRTTQADPFAIISDATVGASIKRWLVDRSLLDDSTATIDVFSYKTRFFKTASKTSGLTFPDKDFEETKYGVSVGDTVYFFTPQGEEAE